MARATHTSCKARPLVLLLCKALGPGAWPSENSTSTREGDSKETGADIPPGVRVESATGSRCFAQGLPVGRSLPSRNGSISRNSLHVSIKLTRGVGGGG